MQTGIQPTLDGFVAFVATILPTGSVPATPPYQTWAYDQALNTVNTQLQCAPGQPGAWSVYTDAVYNLAMHILVTLGQDVTYPIATASWAGGLVTLTTTITNQFQPGQQIMVQGLSPLAYDAGFAKPFVVNSVDVPTNALTYAVAANPGAATLLAGAAVSGVVFQTMRLRYQLNTFAPGLVATGADQGTSVGLDNPDWLKGLTIADLDYIKTPWGRHYQAIAMRVGTIWGLS